MLKNLFYNDGQVPWQAVQARIWTGGVVEYSLYCIPWGATYSVLLPLPMSVKRKEDSPEKQDPLYE